MRNRIESARELALADKSNVKKHRTGNLKGMFCVSYRNPDTTFYCQTEEKRKKIVGVLEGQCRTVKIFET